MRVLGIDPGVNHCGWGLVTEGKPIACGLWRTKNMLLPERILRYSNYAKGSDLGGIDLIVVEFPQIYAAAKQKGRQKDLQDLAAIAGAMMLTAMQRGAEVLAPFPREWKSNIPKEIHGARVLNNLGLSRAIFDSTCAANDIPPSLRHNTLDGLGLALWGWEKERRRHEAAT